MKKKKTALIAVYDKTGAADLARGLVALGFDIVSTGGTAKELKRAKVAVTEVADVTGFPEILEGRVKTLHPRVFGGILARPTPSHRRELAKHKIREFDLVAVNLYPFEKTAGRTGVAEDRVLEDIDVGGVALLRAAAKNYARVVVLSSPGQYAEAVKRLGTGKDIKKWRHELAREAFIATARYDAAIAGYFARRGGGRRFFPDNLILTYHKILAPSYGENPHQQAVFYAPAGATLWEQLAGPPASYNNLLDLAAALALVVEFEKPACAVVKHNSPCGAAAAPTLAEAFRRAWNADALSAYGGVVVFNNRVDEDAAAAMMAKGTFFHLCAAPGYTRGVTEYLKTAKSWTDRLRIFKYSAPDGAVELRSVFGGVLAQEADFRPALRDTWRQVAGPTVAPDVFEDLQFAWAVAKHARSNAIVIARGLTTLAIGAGAVNRLWPAEEAARRAGPAAQGAVAASDGFFPKTDSLEVLCRAGVRAVVAPGGSKADEETVELAKRYGVALFFAERRHFRH